MEPLRSGRRAAVQAPPLPGAELELPHPGHYVLVDLLKLLKALPDHGYWNALICLLVLAAIVWERLSIAHTVMTFVDILYNIIYFVHTTSILYLGIQRMVTRSIDTQSKFQLALDYLSFVPLALQFNEGTGMRLKLAAYYIRLHRPMGFLWSLNDSALKENIMGTALKYAYIFLVLRCTWALIWLNIDDYEFDKNITRRALIELQFYGTTWKELIPGFSEDSVVNKFLTALYVVNKMFIPIGPSVYPMNDIERIVCLLINMSGCLMVTGVAVAAMSSVIGIYIRKEEAFRARFRLIMKEMRVSNIHKGLQRKVATFYRMYWMKQRAVSSSQLLPMFPSLLAHFVSMDIYFTALQKSKILRNLSNQFLNELAKNMTTVYYIPGDTIIKRSTVKTCMIYITYGDIQMLTAEDDQSSILMMSRGTLLSESALVLSTKAYVEIRALTFCQAQILRKEHLDKVRKHKTIRPQPNVRFNSNITHFKNNLIELEHYQTENLNSGCSLQIASFYIIRNETTWEDVSDEICLRSTFPCILQPKSSLLTCWRIVNVFIIILTCMTHPYYLVFRETVSVDFRYYDYVISGVFVLDIFVQLATAVNVEEGVPITFSQTSSQHLQEPRFILDIMAIMPILEIIGDGHFAGLNKLIRIHRVFYSIRDLEEAYVYHGNLIRFFGYMLWLLMACYFIASLQQSFMCYKFGNCTVVNFTGPPYWGEGRLDGENVMHTLVFGMYWSISIITLTAHMETWKQYFWKNVLYTVFILEICVMLYIFIMSGYSAAVMVTRMLREEYDASISRVKLFLVRKRVDPVLRQRFTTYMQLCWYTDKAYSMTEKRSIFYDLPPHVHQEIMTLQRSKYILSIPFMKLLSSKELKKVTSNCHIFYTSRNEILINTGDLSNEMYVIRQGYCEALSPETTKPVGTLGPKSHFGVLECLLRFPAYYTVRAITDVQIFSISRKKILRYLEGNYQIQDALQYCKDQPEYTNLQHKHDEFLYYAPPSAPPSKYVFRQPRKYEGDYDFLHPFSQLGTFRFMRYIYPRYTIRPDGNYLAHYESFRAVCAFASSLLFPPLTYMGLQWPALVWLTFLLDLTAYYDLFQRTLVGYYNEHGMLVSHPVSTSAHYLKGPFVVDLIACLPLEELVVPTMDAETDRVQATMISQCLMLNRLLQLYRLPNAMLFMGSFIQRRDIILLIKAIPLFLALCNVLTAFLVLQSAMIYTDRNNTEYHIDPYPDSWILLYPHAFRFNLSEPANLHLATYYWVVYVTTTTGYNTISPTTFYQMLTLLVAMIVGSLTTTYLSVKIISMRANVNTTLAEYQEHMKDMVAYMQKESLPKSLQKSVIEFYEYNWEKTHGVDYRNVLKVCDQITLRTDAIIHLYGKTFSKCVLFNQLDLSLLRILGRAVVNLYFLKDTRVFGVNDVLSDLYFVDYGEVEVEAPDGGYVCTLGRGSIFGSLESAKSIRLSVSFTAQQNIHLLRIPSKTFFDITKDFPAVHELLTKYRDENGSYIPENMIQMQALLRFDDTSVPAASPYQRFLKTIYNENSCMFFYLIFVCTACVFGDIYNMGFQSNDKYLIMTLYLLDICFYGKIALSCVLPYVSPDGTLVRDSRAIRRRYFRTDLKKDVLSCLPLEMLCLLAEEGNVWTAFSFLRINRLLRIITIYNTLLVRYQRLNVNLLLMTTFSSLLWFAVFVHSAVGVWHYIGVQENHTEPMSSWMYNDEKEPWCHNAYICSLYFVVATFTQNGVGDITPKKQSEVLFVILLQISSMMLCLVYVGEISNIIQHHSYRSFTYYSKYLELKSFMRSNRVSATLMKIVNKYAIHLWREGRGEQFPDFLLRAPHCLKIKILVAAYQQHIYKHPLFADCHEDFLRQLIGLLELVVYDKGNFIVKEGEITDRLYVVHAGHVQGLADDGRLHVRTFTPGQSFGTVQGLYHNTPFRHSYRTLTESEILVLRLDDWADLLEHFPDDRHLIYSQAPDEVTADSLL